MAFPLASVRTQTGPLAAAALTQTVTPLAPGTPTTDALGASVPGTPTEEATVAARIRPETSEERIAQDRRENVTGYRVRVRRTAQTAAWTAAHALRWERSAARGGPIVLTLDGLPVEDHGRGRFLDMTATHTA